MTEVKNIKSVGQLIRTIQNDGKFETKFKQNPMNVLNQVSANQLPLKVYTIVVSCLGAAVLIALIGAVLITILGEGDIPDILIATAAAAIGSLAGLLAPQPN